MQAQTITTAAPPSWSLAVGELGRISVLVSVAMFVLASLFWLGSKWDRRIEKSAKILFDAGCVCIIGTFVFLAVLFLNHRFEFDYVWSHSDLRTAPIYRLAAVWSGQQGSFLLWAVSAAIFGIFAVRKTAEYRRWFSIVYSVFLGGIVAILAYESPFKLILIDNAPVVPADGRGLAPSLMNYWVTIHPPVIFLGFGSLTVLFALALSALISKSYDTWVGIVRPWAILSTTFVGLGLCMGGFWAYETLGWGGFWMWDPVENVSFVPWTLCAALLHGILVQVSKNRWKMANLVMAGLPFLTFVYGTFLTRSGFLADASVHSFAEMDRTALKLLMGVMSVSSIGFLGLWGFRAIQSRTPVSAGNTNIGVHREGMYRLGALLLSAMGLATMVGMSVPLFMAMQGKPPKVVEEALYHKVLPWIYVPLMIVMAISPFVSWNGGSLKDLLKRCYSLLCIAFGASGLVLLGIVLSPLGKLADLSGTSNFPMGIKVPNLTWVVFLSGLSVLIITGTIWRMYDLRKATKLAWSSFIAHTGIAILMMGLITSRGFERKIQTFVMENHPGTLMNYAIRFKGMTSTLEDRENKVQFEVISANGSKPVDFIASPGFYYLESPEGQKSPMSWPHVQRSPLYDLYFTMHEPQRDATEPFTLLPGEQREFSGFVMTYNKLVKEGESGVAGTKFGAELNVKSSGKEFTATPKMELGQGGPQQIPSNLGDNFEVQMVSMDAASKAVTLQVQLRHPMYPLEIYVKPLTSLVWLGTFVMTIGGFMSAYYRRVARKVTAKVKLPETEDRNALNTPLIPI